VLSYKVITFWKRIRIRL